MDVGDNEEDAPRSPPPDDDADDGEGSVDQEKDKTAKHDNKSDDMVTDEAPKDSGVKGGGGNATSEPMQEHEQGANSPQVGVVFSPMLKKQFELVREQLLSLAANNGTADLSPLVVNDGNGSGDSDGCVDVVGSDSPAREEVIPAGDGGSVAYSCVGSETADFECSTGNELGTLVSHAEGVAGNTPVVSAACSDDGGQYLDRQGIPLSPQPQFCGQEELEGTPTAGELAGKPSEREIMAFRGMMEVEVKSSLRLREQHNADLPQLQRAMDLAARKTYGFPPGISPNNKPSLHSLSSAEIKRRASVLGISLGGDDRQVDSSISMIREVERERSFS